MRPADSNYNLDNLFTYHFLFEMILQLSFLTRSKPFGVKTVTSSEVSE